MPHDKPKVQSVHFIHGEQDPVIDLRHSVQASHTLERLGVAVTLDVVPGLGHGIDTRVASTLNTRLQPRAA